ncbi:hypothetical protein BDV12DRAFT_177649 [Aspergillus spectabilis]
MHPRHTHGETAFFGLPGNPVAAAACLRVFVCQYLRTLQLQEPDQPVLASLRLSSNDADGISRNGGTSKSPTLESRREADVFRPAILTRCGKQVCIIVGHSPGKTEPCLHANCWVHIPRRASAVHYGDPVSVDRS